MDQSLQPPPFVSGEDYHYDAAVATWFPGTGQEFTPTMTGLNFVDVDLANIMATNTGTFEVAIHQGTITTPDLGVSDSLWISGDEQGDTEFLFPSTVPLAPGDLYVLEIIQVSGNSGWGVALAGSGTINGQPINLEYPGGRFFYQGVPQDNEDMIFSEGMTVPEPDVAALFALAALGFCANRKGAAARA